MADKGWSRKFDDPIPLPRGRQLSTLRHAASYNAKLPKAQDEAPLFLPNTRMRSQQCPGQSRPFSPANSTLQRRRLSCRGSRSLNSGMSASTMTRESNGCGPFLTPIRQSTEVAFARIASLTIVQTYALWRAANLAKAASWSATAFRVGSSLSSSVPGSNLV
jgi:hypothetical protein